MPRKIVFALYLKLSKVAARQTTIREGVQKSWHHYREDPISGCRFPDHRMCVHIKLMLILTNMEIGCPSSTLSPGYLML